MTTQFPRLQFHPVTPNRWRDFKPLLGDNGTCTGCRSRSVRWSLARAELTQKHDAGNQRATKKLIATGQEPGILAYADGKLIGWCASVLREAYPALDRSPVLQRVDDRPVWLVKCFDGTRRAPTRPMMRYFVDQHAW